MMTPNRLLPFLGKIFNPDPRVALPSEPLPSPPNVEMLRANMLNAMKAVEGLRAKLALAEEQRDFLLNGLVAAGSLMESGKAVSSLLTDYRSRWPGAAK